MRERTARAAGLLLVGRASDILRRFCADTRGATALEYAMIGGLIFAVIAGSLRLYGSKMSSVYGQIGSAMAQVN